MGESIIIASITVYALTVIICLFVVTNKVQFESADEMFQWVRRKYPLVFIPIVNTVLLLGGTVITVLIYIFWIIKKLINKLI